MQGWCTALFAQPAPPSDLHTRDVPVLRMVAGESPASSAIEDLLLRELRP